MGETGKVYPVDNFVGRTVLSRASANRVGQLHDFIIDPVEGWLAGLEVRMSDDSLRCIEYGEVHSIGPDAVMINNENSALPEQSSPLKALPPAINKLVGAEVVTESGKVLGHVANVFINLDAKPLLIYEVRSSLLDKLLGHALFFPASLGRAFSGHDARLVVADETAEEGVNGLEALVAKLFGPPREADPVVVVRSRGH